MEIRDYPLIESLANDDLFLIQTASDGAYKSIKKASLLSSGSTSNPEVNLTYISDGDTNGVFYYIGTSGKTQPWVNPSTIGLEITASATEHGSLSDLVDRVGSEYWSPSVANSWVSFFLGGSKLKCNHYSIKSRLANSDYYPRNFTLQGSNDSNAWIDLDAQVNNTGLNSVNQWLTLPVASTTNYLFFRLITTGNNSSGYGHLCLGEVELYGIFAP